MKKQWNFRRLMMGGGMQIVLAVFLAAAFLLVGSPVNAATVCEQTAAKAYTACTNATNEVFNLALCKCLNLPKQDQAACIADANTDKTNSNDECKAQKEARGFVCVELGGGAYELDYTKVNFTTPDSHHQNQYFPLIPMAYTYFSYDSKFNRIEKDVVTVTNNTRNFDGVICRVIHDVVTDLTVGGKNGQKTEDTTDWYALDTLGNVWYFGEIAQQFENNILVGIDGSWTTGKDGARPGYNMLAKPKKGDVYRQEFALGEAEDMARVMGKVSINEILVDNKQLDDFFTEL
jgi:hypothetical protein